MNNEVWKKVTIAVFSALIAGAGSYIMMYLKVSDMVSRDDILDLIQKHAPYVADAATIELRLKNLENDRKDVYDAIKDLAKGQTDTNKLLTEVRLQMERVEARLP